MPPGEQDVTITEGTHEAVRIKSGKETAVIKEDFNYFIEGRKHRNLTQVKAQ